MISNSTNRLSDAILLQQETLIQQQQTLSDFIRTEATVRHEQSEIMQKQLETIMSLAPKPVVARVPPSHFKSSKADGISFASTLIPWKTRKMRNFAHFATQFSNT